MLRRLLLVLFIATLFLIPFRLEAASLPSCDDHDPLIWHALIRADGACHYDHEHKDDPNSVNDIFGVPGAWWGSPGQSIAYPWLTSEMENTTKHGGFGWLVRRGLPCLSYPCISAFRVQYHAIMAQVGMETRLHSHSGEYQVNHGDGTYGILRRGGWLDFGGLTVNGTTKIPPSIADSPAILRFHLEPTDFQVQYGSRAIGVWYGEPVAADDQFSTRGRVGIHVEDVFGRYSDDGSLHLFGGPYNSSTVMIKVIEIAARQMWDTNFDGRVDLRAYTDRNGQIVSVAPWGDGDKLIDRYGIDPTPATVTVGLDRIPLVIENVPGGNVIPTYKEYQVREYDTSFSGESWITYPN